MFDLAAQDLADGKALGVEPGVEIPCEVSSELFSECSAVFVGVRDEDAQWPWTMTLGE